MLTLQSEWVLYPFLSVAANANANTNALCERALNVVKRTVGADSSWYVICRGSYDSRNNSGFDA